MLFPEADALLQEIASLEAATAPGEIRAELVYVPRTQRMANVTIRPASREYEINAGVSAGVDQSRVIPLNELVVGVENNRYYVRYLRTGQRIRFHSGHMLTSYNAPPVLQFLSDVSFDGRMMFNSFDWGPAETFPFLPRIQKEQIVLRPAQWRIQKESSKLTSPAAFDQWLCNWSAEWDLPRRICLSAGDNRLILDLEQRLESEELRAELLKLPEGSSLVVQEVLPDFEDAWLEGTHGHYFHEFVLSLFCRQHASSTPSETQPKALWKSNLKRNHIPGSEWLFIKLYGPRDLENELITDAILPFAQDIVETGLAD
jgi:hypothetical protein